MFRNSTTVNDPTSLQSKRRLQKQIETIDKIIAAIEKPPDHSIIPDDAELLTIPQVARLLGWGDSVVLSEIRKACCLCLFVLAIKTGRISQNPIQYLQSLKELDKVRPRRALTKGEVDRLITATINADKHHGLTGDERKLAYLLAIRVGLRYNEIYTLTRMDIDLENKLQVTVKASNAKNRKAQPVPLLLELPEELERYFAENLAMPHTKVFPRIWQDAGAEMLRADLELADIEYETEDGFADFHSLRHTGATLYKIQASILN